MNPFAVKVKIIHLTDKVGEPEKAKYIFSRKIQVEIDQRIKKLCELPYMSTVSQKLNMIFHSYTLFKI